MYTGIFREIIPKVEIPHPYPKKTCSDRPDISKEMHNSATSATKCFQLLGG